MKKVVSIVMAVLMFVMCASVFAACKSGKNSDWEFDKDNNVVIKIGSIGPLTGDYASYGISVKNGAQVAVDEINASGKFEGIKFQLMSEDSQGDPTRAVSAFDKHVDNGMKVSLGGTLSGETAQIVATSVESGMLVLTPTASSLSCIGEPNAFRVCYNDPQQGEAAAQEIAKAKMATKIALFYDNGNDYCTGNVGTFKQKAAELGLEIVTEQTFTETTNTDFSTQITAIKNSGAEMVFMPIYYAEAARFLHQAKDQLEVKYFGVDGLDGLIEECGEANKADCEDVLLLTPFYAAAEGGVTKAFVDAYKAKFGTVPDQFAADGYDAVITIAEVVKSFNKTGAQIAEMSVADFNAAMVAGMVKVTVEGATGTMTWTANGETNKAPKILQIKDGAYVEYKA